MGVASLTGIAPSAARLISTGDAVCGEILDNLP
jgi:hypothetical protein